MRKPTPSLDMQTANAFQAPSSARQRLAASSAQAGGEEVLALAQAVCNEA